MRLRRAAIILLLALPLLGSSCGPEAAPAGRAAAKGIGQLVAENVDQVDPGTLAGKARVGLPDAQQAKEELQSGSSGLIDR
jgi:hypothetical protein